MSLEAALADNTASNKGLTAALLTVAANQEKLLAGQAAAIEKIEGGKAGKTPATPKKTETVKPTPAANVVTDEALKNAAVAWMNASTKGKSDADAKAIKGDAAKFLGDILTFFGCGGKLTGAESKLDDDQRKQAKFFIERKAAGLPVDFSADYDLDGDVKQGAAAEAEEDPLG